MLPVDEHRGEAVQFLFVDVHHLMMVGKQQHLLLRLQQRPDKLRHIGRFGYAGCLPLALLDFHGPQSALGSRCIRLTHQGEGLGNRLHQLAVYAFVAVHSHNQPAFGRQFLEHFLLGALACPFGPTFLFWEVSFLYRFADLPPTL